MLEHQQTQQSTELKHTFQKQAIPIVKTPISNSASIIQRARINPKSLTAADVLQVQRTIGNRAVGRLLSEIRNPSKVQRKTVQRQIIPEEEKEPLQGMFGKEPEEETCPSCMQRQEKPEEEEPLQGKFETIQRLKPEEEEKLQMKSVMPRQEISEEEDEPIQGKMIGTIQRQEISEEEPLQTKRENNTGMPDNLKAGVESLSGIDMSDVKVHYNSDKPAKVGALAYTQGSNIHVAPGQERHLPHEAWHVVQQARGRVKPTIQLKEGVPVNDDEGLEHEADVMGNKTSTCSINRDSLFNAIRQNKKCTNNSQKERQESQQSSQFLLNCIQCVIQLRKNKGEYIRHSLRGTFGKVARENGNSPNFLYDVNWYVPTSDTFDKTEKNVSEQYLGKNLDLNKIVGKSFELHESRDVVLVQQIRRKGTKLDDKGRDEREDLYLVKYLGGRQESEMKGALLTREIENLSFPDNEQLLREGIKEHKYLQVIPQNMERKEKVWGYRGDSREPGEIFKEGFVSRYNMSSPIFRSSLQDRGQITGQHDIDPYSAINAARNPIAACIFPLDFTLPSYVYVFQADKFFDTKKIQEWAASQHELANFEDDIKSLLFAEEMAVSGSIPKENIIGVHKVERKRSDNKVELIVTSFTENDKSKFQKMDSLREMLTEARSIPKKFIFHLPTKGGKVDDVQYLADFQIKKNEIRKKLPPEKYAEFESVSSGIYISLRSSLKSGCSQEHLDREYIFNSAISELENYYASSVK